MAQPTKIFRYKLSDAILLSISQFSKIHQLDDRHTYKEAWVQWLHDEQDEVEREIVRLQQLNYKGDVVDKMFKAGRYYFREKVTEKKAEPKTTRNYIVMDASLIQAMDKQLHLLMQQKDFKPAAAYTQFCNDHVELLQKEHDRLGQYYTAEALTAKFKKAYKNRYFILKV
jgi:hypothetical protein